MKLKISRYKFSFALILVFCLLPFMVEAVIVTSVSELASAVVNANTGGDKEILMADGTYILNDILEVTAAGITVRSLSGLRDRVTIKGQGMYGSVSHIFLVAADDFTLRDMTLGWVANHAVQIQGELGAGNTLLSNLRIVDTYEQMVKISYNSSSPNYSENGVLENCLLEYTDEIGPQYYIGGIDGHQTKNWIVRNNTFKYFISPGGDIAEHAIHFWSGSEDTLVEGNLILNCDRGIGFGLNDRGHIRGIIRNNMIYHNANDYSFADVGIILENASNVQVYNNTIFMEHSYSNAIEYRWGGTSGGIIANNLTNKSISSRDGGSASVFDNVTSAAAAWFINPGSGDLHLKYAVPSVLNQGSSISGLLLDLDREPRPQGGGIDVGADEYKNWLPLKRLTWNHGDSVKPALIRSPNDTLHVFWEDYSYGNNEIISKTSLDGGENWTSPIRLTWTGASSQSPSVVVDSGENIHLVYEDFISGKAEIYYKKGTGKSVAWSAPQRMTWNSGESCYPVISTDPGDLLHLFWQDDTFGNNEIFYKRSINGGLNWSAPQRLTWTSGDSVLPEVVIDLSSSIFLFWEESISGNSEIFCKQSQDGGLTWSVPARLSWNSGDSVGPKAVVDINGLIHLTWGDLPPGNAEIFYKKTTDQGITWTSSRRMTWNNGNSLTPDLGSDPNGNIYLVWAQLNSDRYELYMNRSSSQGDIWPQLKRITWTEENALHPSLLSDSSSDLHLIWCGDRSGNFELYYKKR